MRRRWPTTPPDEPLFEAQQRMAEAGVPALPVVDAAGNLVGLLTAGGINEAYRLLSVNPGLASRAGGAGWAGERRPVVAA